MPCFFVLTLTHIFISLFSLKYNTQISGKDQGFNKLNVEPEITYTNTKALCTYSFYAKGLISQMPMREPRVVVSYPRMTSHLFSNVTSTQREKHPAK